MCIKIRIPSERREIRTIYELQQRVGKKNVRLLPHYPPQALLGRHCLCGIDTDHAAEAAGFVSDRSDPLATTWLAKATPALPGDRSLQP